MSTTRDDLLGSWRRSCWLSVARAVCLRELDRAATSTQPAAHEPAAQSLAVFVACSLLLPVAQSTRCKGRSGVPSHLHLRPLGCI
ncbi:unnamed protein product [Polarella glacialis]|uniref:Uncharacterized protein n=1 Tax=Polarella glacialis TaxID=89957 RepID=A0A813I2X9_POLGL|nr:unnamed protein product [Polarella glacialis]